MQLSQRQPDGYPLRQHLLTAQAQGVRTPQLEVQPPEGCELLVEAFQALRGTCGAGLGSANPIAPSEIEVWARLQGLALTPWEVDTLLAMDRAANTAGALPPPKG